MSSAFRINTNIQSQQAFQNLQETNQEVSQLRERLTTGKRINSASDDAAGFEIANQLESKTGAQGEALRNIGDAKSLLSTAEGSLDSQLNILQTMKEKATQAANDSLSSDERDAIQGELDELTSELQDIAGGTEFNGQNLIGSESGGADLTFQTGEAETDTFNVNLDESTATNLGVGSNTSTLSDGSSLKNTTFNEGNVAGLSLADSGGNVTFEGNDDNKISTDSSNVLDSDQQLKNLDGGKFDLEITTDNASNASSGFQVSVDGGGEQNLSASGNIKGGASGNVTLEFDAESGDGIQLDFEGADAKALNSSIKDSSDGSVDISFEAGGDGVEFTNDVAASGNTGEQNRKSAIKNIDSAINTVTSNLSDLGTTQNRLSFKESNLETSRTNLNEAQSRIEDADFAQTQTQVAKLQVQQQSGTAQLAQANAAGQSVLSLLQ